MQVDPKRSSVAFNGSSSVHPIHIRCDAPEGELTFGDSRATGSLVVPTGKLKTGQLLQDLELRRRIQASRFKTITATLTALTPAGEASGEITFMGVTQGAQGTLFVEHHGDELRVTGEATFDVRTFGFDPPNILGMKVHPEVTVTVDLVLT